MWNHTSSGDNLLTTLEPGAVFGQVGLFESGKRSASCVVCDDQDCILIELEKNVCKKIFNEKTGIAPKLLAILTDGLISTIHEASGKLFAIRELKHEKYTKTLENF